MLFLGAQYHYIDGKLEIVKLYFEMTFNSFNVSRRVHNRPTVQYLKWQINFNAVVAAHQIHSQHDSINGGISQLAKEARCLSLSVRSSLSLSVCLSFCLSVCLFIYLSVCLSVCLCLSGHMSVCLSECLSVSVR